MTVMCCMPVNDAGDVEGCGSRERYVDVDGGLPGIWLGAVLQVHRWKKDVCLVLRTVAGKY